MSWRGQLKPSLRWAGHPEGSGLPQRRSTTVVPTTDWTRMHVTLAPAADIPPRRSRPASEPARPINGSHGAGGKAWGRRLAASRFHLPFTSWAAPAPLRTGQAQSEQSSALIRPASLSAGELAGHSRNPLNAPYREPRLLAPLDEKLPSSSISCTNKRPRKFPHAANSMGSLEVS
jgi:hypothetical protein